MMVGVAWVDNKRYEANLYSVLRETHVTLEISQKKITVCNIFV